MSRFAIQVEGLGKEYIIGGAEQRHDTFREMLTGSLTAPLRRLRKLGGEACEQERFWALKDVSFNVEQGEVLGIIGRNGAGKSTLLKVLSRITSPSEGRVTTRGRVASLLEVGTGFHPELSGRENIFLNGAVLGMTRKEICNFFDEIVAFAEVEKFLDTPVKRYSSGMYVRLAFSVAAHLQADILIVDEVLAVGDSRFQDRCLKKMGSLSGDGRTVILVSHNVRAIEALAKKSLLLDSGKGQAFGATREVVKQYAEANLSAFGYVHTDLGILQVESSSGHLKDCGDRDVLIVISFQLRILQAVTDMYIDFGLENESGVRILQIVPNARRELPLTGHAGQVIKIIIECRMTKVAPGEYSGTIYAHSQLYGGYLYISRLPLFQVAADRDTPEVISPGFTSVLLPNYVARVSVE